MLETPKVKLWAMLKNKNDILENLESITFVDKQDAIEELAKESNMIVLMSYETFGFLRDKIINLEQENATQRNLTLDQQNIALSYWERLERIENFVKKTLEENTVSSDSLKTIKEICEEVSEGN